MIKLFGVSSMRTCALLFFFVFFQQSIIYAQTPRTFSYQGIVVNANGSPIQDGKHVVKVALYETVFGGASVYTESILTDIKSGLFTLEIGAIDPIPATILFDRRYYLGIIVDNGNEMSPRTPLISVPTAIHADVADYAKAVSSGAKGVVTSLNEISGPLVIAGDSSISVSSNGRIIHLHAIIQNESAIRSILDTGNTMLISNPNGPQTKIGVADNAISTRKIIDGAVTLNKINQAGATNGQVLKWNGLTWIPSEDMNFAPVAGNDITIVGNIISVTTPLPIGTVNNSTLRWTGMNWIENTNFLSTAAGLTTINNNILLSNNGQASELRFFEPVGSGLNYTAFKTQSQAADITYTLPASLPSSLALLTVDNSGRLNWATSFSMQVPFDQITSGINQGQTLTVGNGSFLAPFGTGTVTANQFVGSGSLTNAVDLQTGEIAGILPIQNGGTNSGTALLGNRLMISKNGAIIEFDGGNSGQVLSSNGTNAPSWNTVILLPNGTINNSTLRWNASSNTWQENINVLTSSVGLVTANGGVNLNTTSSPLELNGSAGTTGQFLTSAGSGSTPTWTTGSLLTNGTATDNTLRWNGTAWVETSNVKSSSAGLVTANAGVNLNTNASPLQLNSSAGTSGQFLTSAGAGSTPTWTTGSLLTNGTATDNTLRWNGTAWVETANVKSSSAGLVTANAGVNLNTASSPLQLNGSAGTSGQFLTSAGAGSTPTWTTGSLLTNGTATDNTLRWNGTAWVESPNVKSSSAGLVTANAGLNLNTASSPLQLNGSAGSTGQFLTSAGAGSTPTWTTGSLLTNGTATDNTLRWNGTAWVETSNVTSSTAGLVTVKSGINLSGTVSSLQLNGSAGNTGQFLTSAGAGSTPTWTTGNLLTNGTAVDNTLRWNGTTWVESANVKSSSVGLVTANAGVNLNGIASPLQVNGSSGTVGQFLSSGGVGATPSWTTFTAGSNITLTSGSGTLTLSASGGLSNGTATDNTLRWNGTTWVETANVKSSTSGQVTANAGVNLNTTTSPLQLNGSAGTTGQFLTSAGAGSTPTWTTGSLLSNGTVTDNTLRWNGTSWVETSNVKSSSAGLVTANAGVNLNTASSPLQLNGSAGTTGQFLTSAGAGSTPTWTTGSLLSNGTVTDNTLRWNGTSWVETSNVKSSSAGLVTANAGVNLNTASSPLQLNGSAGTTGQFLTSAGAGSTPTWTTGSLLSNGTATDNTLRWNGTSWVETSNVTSSTAGFVTVKAGTNLSGIVSPLQLNGAAGAVGQVLTSAGAGNTPTWSTVNILTNGTATDNTLRWNGSNWVETANVTSSASGLVTVKGGINHSGVSSPLQLNGSAGITGQFLTSAGAGNTPTWVTGSLLPNGTATDNTLRWNGTSWVETSNIKSSAAGMLTANAGVTLNGTTSPLKANGSDGTLNSVLTSQGAGNTPQWIDPNTLINNAWKLTGNSGITPGMGAGQNYIGTNDAKDLYIGQNGFEHIRISSTGSSTNTIPLGVIHTRSVLPGGLSTLITGLTVETLLPSSASNPIVPVGGLFSFSTVNNSFSLGIFCAANSSVYISGTANTNTVRALDGIYYVQNTTSGITHLNAVGVYGSIQTLPFSNNTTITNASALKTDYQLNSTNSTITTANGLYVENPFLGFFVPSTAIGTFNGIYIENLTTGTTKRAFFYDGSSGNAPVAITSAGQLGIGRNDPTQSLEIRNGHTLLSNNNNTADELRFAEPSGNGSFYSSFKAGAQSATINYTLPLTLPAANNGILISSTAGILNWGSNLAWDNANFRLGANTTAPATTIDANGDLALRENSFTAANGNNNDITIGNFSFVRIAGPNGAFTITGIANGVNGKMVILYNSTAQSMTISHNDVNSTTAGDRIYCKGGVNYTVGQYGIVTLIYNSTDSKWVVLSTN